MELFLQKKTLILGHRGNSLNFPDNTEPAFENIGGATDGIETDIQLSKDGVPVLYHNRTLKKITGLEKKIYTLTLSELQKLDFGSWFSSAFRGTRIISLNEFLLKYGKRKKLFLEIKARYDDPPQIYRKLTELVISLVTKNSLKKSVALLSFNSDVLQYGHKLCNQVAWMQILKKQDQLTKASVQEAPWLKGYVVALNILSRNFVGAAHKRGEVICVFSCNTEEELSLAKDLGVDAIISDNPKAAARWIKK